MLCPWARHIIRCLVLVQVRKTGNHSDKTEKLFTDTKSIKTNKPGVVSSIPARSHTFVETDHEIISMVILLPSPESFKKGCCQLQAKVCAQGLVNCSFKLAQEKVWLGELTLPP